MNDVRNKPTQFVEIFQFGSICNPKRYFFAYGFTGMMP